MGYSRLYELSKGKYVEIEPQEIEAIQLEQLAEDSTVTLPELTINSTHPKMPLK